MNNQEKWEETKRNIQLVRRYYRPLMSEYEAIMSSRGAVSAWGGVGGRSGRTAHPTQDRALSAIEYEARMERMRNWLACVRQTHARLNSRDGKSPNLWRHQRQLARALQAYVFERADDELLAFMISGVRRVNRRYAGRVLREALHEVMADAEAAGLFREGSAGTLTGAGE